MKKKPILNGKALPEGSHQANVGREKNDIAADDGYPVESKKVWLDKQEVMQRMHISSRTLQKWRSRKMIPYSKIDGKIYYRESDLQELLLRHLQ